jgi:hypothetical protein
VVAWRIGLLNQDKSERVWKEWERRRKCITEKANSLRVISHRDRGFMQTQ